jgi:hypothetical protein
MSRSLGELTCPPCVTLPSAQAASQMIRGEPGGWPGVVGSTLFRAGLIALGLWAVGERKNVFRNSLAGACSVELFVIAWAAAHQNPAKPVQNQETTASVLV